MSVEQTTWSREKYEAWTKNHHRGILQARFCAYCEMYYVGVVCQCLQLQAVPEEPIWDHDLGGEA